MVVSGGGRTWRSEWGMRNVCKGGEGLQAAENFEFQCHVKMSSWAK